MVLLLVLSCFCMVLCRMLWNLLCRVLKLGVFCLLKCGV